MADLQGFHSWLLRYGRSDGTADQYVAHVRRALELSDPLEKLVDRDLSANSLQTARAALKAYAAFCEDEELLKEISRVRLPPARRLHEEAALDKETWKELRAEIDGAEYLSDPMRGELGMLATRGFRCGDVLRLRRDDVAQALKSGILSYEAKGRRRLEFSVTKSWRGYLEIFADFSGWDHVWDLISPEAKKPKLAAAKAVERALEKCAEEIGVDTEDIHPHLLRKTYATYYYELCQDPVKLKDHMQWAKIETAMLYVQPFAHRELDAIAEKMFH